MMEESTNKNVVEYMALDGKRVGLSVEICRKYLVQGRPEYVSAAEFKFFMALCETRRLNPFTKDCYLIKYTSEQSAAIVVSADFHKAIARSQTDCAGWRNGIIVKNEGSIEYRDGTFIMDGETLAGGWFKAKPKGWEVEFVHTVSLKPYIKYTSAGKPTAFWATDKQALMIAKVALVQGLRTLWPAALAKLYTQEEVIEERSTLSENWADDVNVKSEPESTEDNTPDDTLKWQVVEEPSIDDILENATVANAEAFSEGLEPDSDQEEMDRLLARLDELMEAYPHLKSSVKIKPDMNKSELEKLIAGIETKIKTAQKKRRI